MNKLRSSKMVLPFQLNQLYPALTMGESITDMLDTLEIAERSAALMNDEPMVLEVLAFAQYKNGQRAKAVATMGARRVSRA